MKQQRLIVWSNDLPGKQPDARAVRERRFDLLQVLFDVERDTSRRDFQPLATTLALEVAILVERAEAEPAQRRDRQQRSDGKEDGNLSSLEPVHDS